MQKITAFQQTQKYFLRGGGIWTGKSILLHNKVRIFVRYQNSKKNEDSQLL